MSLTKPERETIVTMNDEEDTAEVWTAQRPRITQLKARGAELVEEGRGGWHGLGPLSVARQGHLVPRRSLDGPCQDRAPGRRGAWRVHRDHAAPARTSRRHEHGWAAAAPLLVQEG